MLSICIPVYNKDIVPLVHSLHAQCMTAAIPFEIRCIDDHSYLFKEKNNQATSLSNVFYSELERNVGRAVIRNMLASEARYDHILFVDSDVSIPHTDFIEKYASCIRQGNPVVTGGISYNPEQVEKNTELHFAYGTKRESRPAAVRNKNPYSSFLTGNLLVLKKIVQEIQFLSSLKEYGHEDTLFCLELKKKSIPVLHIDNPVIHEGLEPNEVFVQKQLTAVRNLALLVQQGYNMKGISLYNAYLSLQKYRLAGVFHFIFGLFDKWAYRRLISGKSKWLRLFDLLRLYRLIGYLN